MRYWWECALVRPLRRAVWGLLDILKMEIAIDSVIPLGTYPKENKNTNLNRDMPSLFTAALFTVGKTWKQPR